MSIEKINIIAENAQAIHENQKAYVDNAIAAIPVTDKKLSNSTSSAYSDNAISYGDKNYAGYKCQKVLSYTNNTTISLTLDTVGENKLAVGDLISIDGGQNYPYCAKITSVSSDGTSIQVDRAIVDSLGNALNPSTEDHLLYVDGKPNTGTHVLGKGQTATGLSNHAIANGAAAFGRQNYASGGYSFAAGRNNHAANYATAMGKENLAHGIFSIAMGVNNKTEAPYTAAIGFSSDATDKDSMALGTRCHATGNGSWAAGWESTASGDKSIALSGVASGVSAVAIKGTASGNHSTALRGTAEGEYAVSAGDGAFAAGTNSFAANKGQATKGYATAFGTSTASNTYAFAANRDNIASGGDSAAFGYGTKASGWASMTTGASTRASGQCSFAGGQGSNAAGSHSIAFGYGINTSSSIKGQAAFGQFNWADPDALLIVGNGVANEDGTTTQKNAFTVLKDGSAKIQTMGTSDNSIATRKFVLDNMGGDCKLDALGKLEDYSYTDADGKLWNYFAFTGDHTILHGKYMALECSSTLSGIYIKPEGTSIGAYEGTVNIWSSNGTSIHNVVTPTEDTDAANKAYVDAIAGSGELSRTVIILNGYEEVLKITYTNGDIKYVLPNASTLTDNENYYEFDMTEELNQYDLYNDYMISLTGFSKVSGWYMLTNDSSDSKSIESPTYVSLYGTKIRTKNLKLYNLPEEYAYLGDGWTYCTQNIELNLYKKP